jgi:hypothetical protein
VIFLPFVGDDGCDGRMYIAVQLFIRLRSHYVETGSAQFLSFWQKRIFDPSLILVHLY